MFYVYACKLHTLDVNMKNNFTENCSPQLGWIWAGATLNQADVIRAISLSFLLHLKEEPKVWKFSFKQSYIRDGEHLWKKCVVLWGSVCWPETTQDRSDLLPSSIVINEKPQKNMYTLDKLGVLLSPAAEAEANIISSVNIVFIMSSFPPFKSVKPGSVL